MLLNSCPASNGPASTLPPAGRSPRRGSPRSRETAQRWQLLAGVPPTRTQWAGGRRPDQPQADQCSAQGDAPTLNPCEPRVVAVLLPRQAPILVQHARCVHSSSSGAHPGWLILRFGEAYHRHPREPGVGDMADRWSRPRRRLSRAATRSEFPLGGHSLLLLLPCQLG